MLLVNIGMRVCFLFLVRKCCASCFGSSFADPALHLVHSLKSILSTFVLDGLQTNYIRLAARSQSFVARLLQSTVAFQNRSLPDLMECMPVCACFPAASHTDQLLADRRTSIVYTANDWFISCSNASSTLSSSRRLRLFIGIWGMVRLRDKPPPSGGW